MPPKRRRNGSRDATSGGGDGDVSARVLRNRDLMVDVVGKMLDLVTLVRLCLVCRQFKGYFGQHASLVLARTMWLDYNGDAGRAVRCSARRGDVRCLAYFEPRLNDRVRQLVLSQAFNAAATHGQLETFKFLAACLRPTVAETRGRYFGGAFMHYAAKRRVELPLREWNELLNSVTSYALEGHSVNIVHYIARELVSNTRTLSPLEVHGQMIIARGHGLYELADTLFRPLDTIPLHPTTTTTPLEVQCRAAYSDMRAACLVGNLESYRHFASKIPNRELTITLMEPNELQFQLCRTGNLEMLKTLVSENDPYIMAAGTDWESIHCAAVAYLQHEMQELVHVWQCRGTNIQNAQKTRKCLQWIAPLACKQYLARKALDPNAIPIGSIDLAHGSYRIGNSDHFFYFFQPDDPDDDGGAPRFLIGVNF